MDIAKPKKRNLLLYDGHCPFCDNLVQYWQLQKSIDNLQLKNARQEPDLVAHYQALGFPIEDGIILDLDGTIHFGDRAIYICSTLTKHKHLSKLFVKLFQNETVAARIYSVMKFGRGVTLKILGRKAISPDSSQD